MDQVVSSFQWQPTWQNIYSNWLKRDSTLVADCSKSYNPRIEEKRKFTIWYQLSVWRWVLMPLWLSTRTPLCSYSWTVGGSLFFCRAQFLQYFARYKPKVGLQIPVNPTTSVFDYRACSFNSSKTQARAELKKCEWAVSIGGGESHADLCWNRYFRSTKTKVILLHAACLHEMVNKLLVKCKIKLN